MKPFVERVSREFKQRATDPVRPKALIYTRVPSGRTGMGVMARTYTHPWRMHAEATATKCATDASG